VGERRSEKSLLVAVEIRGDRRLLALLSAALFAITPSQSTHNTPNPGTTYTANVPLRTLHLADNSTVMLHKGGVLNVRFTAEGREIELPQGEAMFLVAPDARRPFRVAAGNDVSVQVVGTAFLLSNVDSDHTDVLVTQGRVAVSHGQSGITEVDAGEGLQIQHGIASRIDLSADELDERLSWTNPLFENKTRDLSDIVRTLNEFNDTKLVIKDRSIAHVHINIRISTLTNPEDFANSLHPHFNIEARTERGNPGPKVIGLYGKGRVPKHH
jgi:transmembrane sensor